ncbi:flagellar export chaperone FliS [Sphingomonas sanguinis]|jgi:flagellar protein FliS|uniref:Flagellar secretion chaperone FliS n=1 Tax=Sphingomonas sanguinis TaxID=33051 RepID=A0A147HWM6_9SPHN|nr:flagellar protein FliS [Sphingomonas sanguinis]KTT69329.1 flagellar biosynthesis protein FliS [Sphingomonas sanguinis]KTW01724.1 flagellar biosynthesis protein FliS [Sphingomonas sanguinis]KTW09405.1 flagellar biosynthesis protein FliS [Sphingomonas sanguinis]MBZ6381896.1 flagellar protein FliS [Sphingomonas sanguinis]NNG48654.1 flagellar protein FliS [Sphingomonas sanguinis]
MGYATGLLADPAATYRQIDVVGRTATADGPELVQLLYEELISSLRSAAWATEHGQLARKSERVTRATAILFALEAGLDFENGGDISITFAKLYTGARRQIVEGSLDQNPQVFRDVAASIADIAEAWETVRQMNKKKAV